MFLPTTTATTAAGADDMTLQHVATKQFKLSCNSTCSSFQRYIIPSRVKSRIFPPTSEFSQPMGLRGMDKTPLIGRSNSCSCWGTCVDHFVEHVVQQHGVVFTTGNFVQSRDVFSRIPSFHDNMFGQYKERYMLRFRVYEGCQN